MVRILLLGNRNIASEDGHLAEDLSSRPGGVLLKQCSDSHSFWVRLLQRKMIRKKLDTESSAEPKWKTQQQNPNSSLEAQPTLTSTGPKSKNALTPPLDSKRNTFFVSSSPTFTALHEFTLYFCLDTCALLSCSEIQKRQKCKKGLKKHVQFQKSGKKKAKKGENNIPKKNMQKKSNKL